MSLCNFCCCSGGEGVVCSEPEAMHSGKGSCVLNPLQFTRIAGLPTLGDGRDNIFTASSVTVVDFAQLCLV